MISKSTAIVFLWCIGFAFLDATAGLSYSDEGKEVYKYYHVEAKVISLGADQSLASYRSHGGGSGTAGASLGYATPESEIHIELFVESDRFLANVTTVGRREVVNGVAQKWKIDLTDLRPTYLDLGTDKDGRNYQLNLTPSIISRRLKAIAFRKATDDLYRLHFDSSRVMLNDKHYIGRMLASNAEVFRVDVCGVASLEFSLLRLKGAEPWGQLQDGRITLSHPDGTTIEIGNVTNGMDKRQIGGGPYTVWVRWKESLQTIEEYREALSDFRDRVASGETKISAETLAALDKELAREPGPWVISCGACGPRGDDIVRDE